MLILYLFLKGAFCRKIRSLILVGLLTLAASSAQAITYSKSLILTKRVKAGEIKPVAERLPKQPLFVRFKGSKKVPGLYGGSLGMLMRRPKVVRLMPRCIWRRSAYRDDPRARHPAHDRLRLRAPHALRRALQCDPRYYETHSGR